MKNILYIIISILVVTSCDIRIQSPRTARVEIGLVFNDNAFSVRDVRIQARNLTGMAQYEAATDEAGKAIFNLPSGVYEMSVSHKSAEDGQMLIYNGIKADVIVSSGTDISYMIDLTETKANQIIIKELYTGGCPKDDGSGKFSYDQYVILYNNSDIPADASNICFAFCTPANSNTTSKYLADGQLIYEKQGWIPAGWAIWWFTSDIIIEPYSQKVIAMRGAIDHTGTYSNSVDLSNGEYYCMYDTESGFNNINAYPAPSAAISSGHYLKTYRYGLGNSWPLSESSPAFYILNMEGIEEFVKDTGNYDYTENEKLPNVKVPADNIVDGVDVFNKETMNKNNKRLTAKIDAGYVQYTSKLGYTIYRNVDKDATEAIAGNAEKLVYGYAGGTEDVDGTTDPSGIDAEASIANGARIVYMDTNNSTNDFHQRKKASLRK